MGAQCKEFCKHFPKYEKGIYCYAKEGKSACLICHYKIITLYRRCGCCGQQYRRKAHAKVRDRRQRESQIIRIE